MDTRLNMVDGYCNSLVRSFVVLTDGVLKWNLPADGLG